MDSIDVMRERMDFAPLAEFPLFRTGAPYFFDWLAHPYYDDYWRALSIEEQHDKIDVPALNVGGWHDIFMGGTLRNYLGMRARGASVGTPRSSSRDSKWPSVPSRRRMVATRRRISARSRSANVFSAGCAAAPSSWSSRVRCLCRTPSRISAAIRRAARPGTSAGRASL